MNRDNIARELDRVTTRLDTLALHRIDDSVIDAVHASARRIVESTDDPQRPPDAELPRVGPTGLSAQITIVVYDYLETTTATSEDAAVAEILTELRRSLP